jgi:hypothetical protein
VEGVIINVTYFGDLLEALMFLILPHHLKRKAYLKEASSKVVVTICSIGVALMKHMSSQFERKVYQEQLISMTSKA